MKLSTLQRADAPAYHTDGIVKWAAPSLRERGGCRGGLMPMCGTDDSEAASGFRSYGEQLVFWTEFLKLKVY